MVVSHTMMKNGAFLFAANVLTRIFAFILVVLIGRVLGDEGLGLYAFSFAFVEIVGLISEFGIYVLVVREVSKRHSLLKRYVDNYLTAKLALTVGFLVLYNCIVLLMPFDGSKKMVMVLASVCYGLYYLNNPFFSIYQALEKMWFEAMVRTGDSALTVALAFFAVLGGYGVAGVLSAIIISRLVFLVVNYLIVVARFYRPRLRFEFGLWRMLIVKSLPFFLTTLLNTVYFQIDSVMLSFMKGDAVVGWYNAAYRLVSALNFIPATVTYTIYPVLSRLYHSDDKRFKRIVDIVTKFLFMVIWPAALLTFILADRIIILVFGDAFVNSILALQILIFAEVFVFFNLVAVIITNSIEREKAMSLILLSSAVFNVIFNAAVIPRYSYVGAGAVTLVTELLTFLVSLWFIAKVYYRIPILSLTFRILVSGLLMAGVVWALTTLPSFGGLLMLFVLFAVGGIVYLVLILLMKDIKRDEIAFLWDRLRGRDGP